MVQDKPVKRIFYFDNPSMVGDLEFKIKDPANPKRKLTVTQHKKVAIIAYSHAEARALYDGYEWSEAWLDAGYSDPLSNLWQL